MPVDEGGHGEGDDAAGGQGEVGVEHGAVLVVARGQGAVEARPEHPQEHRPCKTQPLANELVGTGFASRYRLQTRDFFFLIFLKSQWVGVRPLHPPLSY